MNKNDCQNFTFWLKKFYWLIVTKTFPATSLLDVLFVWDTCECVLEGAVWAASEWSSLWHTGKNEKS